MTTTTTGFDERALARLPSPAPFLDAIRTQAFEAFEALPIPSQETEEWRYTDLEGLGFDLRPFVERGRVLIVGSILDEAGDMVGSVLLTDFASREEVEAWVADDPYVTGGVWKEIEVLDFRPAVGAWLPDD